MKDSENSNPYSFWIKLGSIVIGSIVAIIFIICLINIFKKNYSKRHVSTSFDSSLEKILNINELHSYEYTYKSWVTIYETKYNMETYNRYKNISTILTKDINIIQGDGVDAEQSFQKYKENLKEQNDKYQDLLSNGASFDILANSGFKDSGLLTIAQKEVTSKDPIDIFQYYYYTLLPKRLTVLTICDNYDDLCDLEQFLRLKESKAHESIKKVKYIVAYKGTVRAGIDEAIKIDTDETGKLWIYIPPVKILSVAVDFLPPEKDSKGNEIKSVIEMSKNITESGKFTKTARLACRNDLYSKINMEPHFLELAEENLKETVKALITPFLNENTTYDFKTLITED